MRAHVIIIVIILLMENAAGCETISCHDGWTSGSKKNALPESCRDMSYLELEGFVRGLGERHDFESLRRICSSDIPNAHLAAGQLAANMNSEHVVAFCKQFEEDSLCWRQAFQYLGSHPKENVIEYIKEMSRSPRPRVRYYCYSVCMGQKWDDLIDNAIRDSHSEESVGFIANLPKDRQALCDIARKYLESCGVEWQERKDLPYR